MEAFRLAIYAGSLQNEEEWPSIGNTICQAVQMMGDAWQIVNAEQANLALVCVNSEQDQRQLAALQDKLPAERIIVLADAAFHINALWHLPLAKQMHTRNLLGMANLFARVQNYWPAAKPIASFDPANSLYGLVRQAMADGVARICQFPSCPELYLLPSENACYLSGTIEDLSPMLMASRQLLDISEVDKQCILETVSYVKFSSRLSSYLGGLEDDLFNEIKVKKYKRYALNELIWFAVLAASQGRLIEGAALEVPVLLKQLPECLRLDHYSKEFKALTDCMSAKALALPELAEVSGYPLHTVIGFYNACAALNLIEHGEAAAKVVEKNTMARTALAGLFKSVAEEKKGRIKIVVAGSVGSGKTTAISTLSDFSPISTETRPSDAVTRKKATTTVAMDYGEMRFNNRSKLFLYGTPGQKRFDFMGQILCENAWGMLLLIDCTEADPVAELDYYLNLYKAYLHKLQIVVGITHTDKVDNPSLKPFQDYLRYSGRDYPVMLADPRDSTSLVKLFAGLLPAFDKAAAMCP